MESSSKMKSIADCEADLQHALDDYEQAKKNSVGVKSDQEWVNARAQRISAKNRVRDARWALQQVMDGDGGDSK